MVAKVSCNELSKSIFWVGRVEGELKSFYSNK